MHLLGSILEERLLGNYSERFFHGVYKIIIEACILRVRVKENQDLVGQTAAGEKHARDRYYRFLGAVEGTIVDLPFVVQKVVDNLRDRDSGHRQEVHPVQCVAWLRRRKYNLV
jgi:hypothetical protein